MSENRYGVEGKEAIHVLFCKQDVIRRSQRSIMRVKLATGSSHEQNPVIAHIKARSKVLITSGT